MAVSQYLKIRLAIAALMLLNMMVAFSSFAKDSGEVYVFDKSKIHLAGVLSPFEASIEIKEQGMQKYILNIYLHSAYAATPPAFNVSIKFPKDKINQIWNSKTWSNKSFFSIPSYDRAAAGFSVIAGLTINDQNQITFTCKDTYKAKFVSSNIREEPDSVVFSLGFFEDNPPLSNLQDYQAEVLVDLRNVHFSKAIYEASSWFLEDDIKKSVSTVDTTNIPVYSTWYPMHRNIPLENITRELDSLKTFGFKSVLVDDGWQALVKMKVDTAYSYEESSFRTMTLFKKKCDQMKLPLYLWYSIPFIGGNPVVLKKFDGKYIRYRAPRQMYVLDPRYADVRKYLISTYSNFLKEWQFNGYWFDFLKGFYPKEGAVIDQDKGRDFVSIDLAVDTLYREMGMHLKQIKPDVFMGQIFPVVGPNLVSYQNFLTGFVGVENTQIVREKMVNNRLLYGVYSPFMEVVAINPKDTDADIARKLQSVLFGNPYLSFYVSTLPESSKKTVRFWLNYWKKNYDVIFNGNFEPIQVSRFYPLVKADNEKKMIYLEYEDHAINLPIVLDRTIDVINSKTSGNIQFVVGKSSVEYNYEIFNCMGESVDKGIMKNKNRNLIDFTVPVAGFIRVSPNSQLTGL